MTGVERTRQAVAEARRDVHEFLSVLAAPVADEARAAIARLEVAVRELAACEIERSEFQRGPISGTNHYVGGYSDGIGDAARIAREGLTKEQP